jgi:hypothetical protein
MGEQRHVRVCAGCSITFITVQQDQFCSACMLIKEETARGIAEGEWPPYAPEDFDELDEWPAPPTNKELDDGLLIDPRIFTQDGWKTVELPTATYEDNWKTVTADELDKPATFEDAFSRIFDEAFTVLVDRQMDYGSTNIARQGIFGVYSRIAFDKVSRLGNLISGNIEHGEVVSYFAPEQGESVEDTLMDIMNYAAILVALKRGWWGVPLADDD